MPLIRRGYFYAILWAYSKEIITKTVQGVYTSAKIFNTNTTEYSIDDYAIALLQALCDNEAFDGCTIRVMPDVHPGKVGTIGFTSTLGKRILPNVKKRRNPKKK